MPKILLVEDNEINRDMLSRRLERQGYEVIVAVNGIEAVDKTLSDQPDLVLMDLHLPILDGWEATRRIKANPQTRAIPVIALTADAIVGEREKALAAGCDEYDTKPVNFSQLLAKMTLLLEPAAPPPAAQPPKVLLASDQQLQRILRTRLRRELDPPIYSIIGYSDMLLDALNGQQSLASDLQKIHASGMQLLRLIHAILNPILVEIQQQDIDLLARTVRLELLTPLSTIIGYSEMLLEEAPADLIPDLEKIHISAQDLLNSVNNLESLVQQHLASTQINDSNELDTQEQILGRSSIRSLGQHSLEPHRSSALKGSRILVIDDSETNCALLSRQLERQGCEVTVRAMAEVNLDQQTFLAVAATSYDLILLDVSLPSGLKVLELLKYDREWRHSPVLIAAVADQMQPIVEGMAMGATDYLTYPFQSVLLRTKVIACLERKRLLEQHGNFDGLWENAPVGVYQAAEGRFRGVNPALVHLLGYPAAATLIETILDIGEQLYVDRNQYSEFKRLLETNDQVREFEYQAYRHDGDLIWVSEYARAVRDVNGQLLYYEGIVEEITQRKLRETALNQQLMALQHELEQVKYAQQAAEIVQTDYFQQLQSGEVQQASQSPTAAPKVLLVEDNELNSDMLSRRLQRYGYDVVIANDGADGVSKALLEQPQVILMDIGLPVMNGWEATQQLKDNSQTCHIPVIALTAHAMTGDCEKALAAGCDDYDTKPINFPRLLNKIEECLKRSAIS